MTEVMKKLPGDRLKERREALGLSMRAAGREAEPPLQTSYISQLENNHVANPSLLFVPRIADAYSLSVPEVLRIYGVDVALPMSEGDVEALRVGQAIMSLPDNYRQVIEGWTGHLLQKHNAQA